MNENSRHTLFHVIDTRGFDRPLLDELCDTIDYATVADGLREWMETQSSQLLEHLAYLIILKIFEFDARIAAVKIEMFKAGCIPFADGALIKMSYSRNESPNYESTRNY